jgi:hypothetical protein
MTMPSAIFSDMRLHKRKIRFLPKCIFSMDRDFSFKPHKLSYSVLCTFYIKITTFFVQDFINILYDVQASMDEKVAHTPYIIVSIFVNRAIQEFDL